MGRSSTAGAAVAALARPLEEAGPLFAFVSAFAPPAASAGWGARAGDRLVGAVLLQRAGNSALVHGPVVALGAGAAAEATVMESAAASAVALGAGAAAEATVMESAAASVSEPAEAQAEAGRLKGAPPASSDDPLDLADRLLAQVLAHAAPNGIETLFARPQGLDRLWVRAGFIPMPEVELPSALRGCPGLGLFAWRGGSAIWSAAGRAAAAAVTGGDGAGGGRAPGRGGRRRPPR